MIGSIEPYHKIRFSKRGLRLPAESNVYVESRSTETAGKDWQYYRGGRVVSPVIGKFTYHLY